MKSYNTASQGPFKQPPLPLRRGETIHRTSLAPWLRNHSCVSPDMRQSPVTFLAARHSEARQEGSISIPKVTQWLQPQRKHLLRRAGGTQYSHLLPSSPPPPGFRSTKTLEAPSYPLVRTVVLYAWCLATVLQENATGP